MSYNPEICKSKEKEKIINWLVNSIRESLDLQEVLQSTVDILGELLSVDGCLITLFDPKICEFEVKCEYRINEKVVSLKNTIFKAEIWESLFKRFQNNASSIANDTQNSNLFDDFQKHYLNLCGIKSLILTPIILKEELLGNIAIYQIEDYRDWDKNSIDLLETIGSQIAIAVKQAKLYSDLKKQSEKERILRNFMTNIRNSFDINEIKKNIIGEIRNFFSADRCFIVEFDPIKNIPLPLDKNSECLSTPDVQSILGIDKKDEKIKSWLNLTFQEKRELIIPDTGEYLKLNNLENMPVKEFLIEYNVKSVMSIPIVYSGQLIGVLVIHFSQERHQFDENEIEFARTIANQAGAVIHTSRLYNTIKQTADRERLLRTISSSIRNSLDHNEVKKNIVNEVGRMFNADRCLIKLFDPAKDDFLPLDDCSEYLSSSDIKSFRDDLQEKRINNFAKTLFKQNKIIIISDLDNIDFKYNLVNFEIKPLATYMKVKSTYGFPIFKDNQLIGFFALDFIREQVKLTNDEVDFLKVLVDQFGIALYQSSLYKIANQNAKRERLLRKIISTIRSSLDISEAIEIICDEVAKLFNVQRATIIEFPDKNNFSEWIVRREYKITADIRGIVNNPDFDRCIGEIWATTLYDNGSNLVIENISESNLPDFCKNSYNQLGQKAIVVIPIKKGSDKWGVIILSEYNYFRKWTEEEVTLLETIADQIYMAIKHAELYSTAKKQEKELRAIFSSLDEGIIVLDSNQFIIDSNQAAAKILTLDSDQLAGHNIEEIKVHPDLKNAILNTLSNPDSFDDYVEIISEPNCCKNGEHCYFQIYSSLYCNEEGIPLGNIVVLKNLTRIKRLEKVRKDFIANVAHELRTPVTLVKGFVETLLNGEVDKPDNSRKFVSIISEYTNRINLIIEGLLTLSKIEQGFDNGDIQLEDHKIKDVIEVAAHICCKKASDKNIKIEISCEDNIQLRVNPLLIEQALINLVNNAIEYSDNARVINIRVAQSQYESILEVADQGCGISEEHLGRIFERFYRVDKGRSRESGGIGLGLAIVRHIIRAHNAYINVESFPGKGTSFFIHFPK